MARTAAAPAQAREARRRAAHRLEERYRAEGRVEDLVRVLDAAHAVVAGVGPRIGKDLLGGGGGRFACGIVE